MTRKYSIVYSSVYYGSNWLIPTVKEMKICSFLRLFKSNIVTTMEGRSVNIDLLLWVINIFSYIAILFHRIIGKFRLEGSSGGL